ncbi:MAG TPA: DUF427 domain-containing protein [Streptosporangiaceae bacterium]|jgi:uncharacterized protein (DUF427 family)
MAGEWRRRLAGFSSRRGAAVGLVAAIALIDNTLHWGHFGFVLRGLIDVPCHAATCLILFGAITRGRGQPPGTWFVWGLLAGSVAIDVDHLPEEFGFGWWSANTIRPHSHALWLVLLLAVIAVLAAARWARARARRGAAILASTAAGAAWGVVIHLYRDAATAPVPLWWPLSDAGIRIPYLAYLLPMILLAILPPPRQHVDRHPDEAAAEAVMSTVGSSGGPAAVLGRNHRLRAAVGHIMGAGHKITITPVDDHVEIWLDGEQLAATDRALLLAETGLPGRYYIPRDDVRIQALRRTGHQTTCPFKGQASYWSAEAGGELHENLVWSYETPIPAVEEIAGYLCFYNEKVELTVGGERQPGARSLA